MLYMAPNRGQQQIAQKMGLPLKFINKRNTVAHCTQVHFASFLSGRFITVIVAYPPEKKLAKRTSVYCD